MQDWSGVADAYRVSFSTLCSGAIQPVLDALTPCRLLDVGCGTGDLLTEAGRRGFQAIGLDADRAMLSMAANSAPVLLAALPYLPFRDSNFEAVTANFVVNHVPDPRAAMRELARVTTERGHVVTTIWPADASGWSALVHAAFVAAGAVFPPSTHLPEHLDFTRSADGLASVARDAGLTVVDAEEIDWTWLITPDDLWAGISGGVATAGQTYLAQPPVVRRRVEAAFFSRTSAAEVRGILEFGCRAVMVVAER